MICISIADFACHVVLNEFFSFFFLSLIWLHFFVYVVQHSHVWSLPRTLPVILLGVMHKNVCWANTVLGQQMMDVSMSTQSVLLTGAPDERRSFYLPLLDLCPLWLILLPCTDMPIFGQCPAQDDFYLVMCSHCGQVVKPQAFQAHYGKCHAHTHTCTSKHHAELVLRVSQFYR